MLKLTETTTESLTVNMTRQGDIRATGIGLPTYQLNKYTNEDVQ